MLANKPLASVPLASSGYKAYTLTAESGAYTLIGQSAELTYLSGVWIPKGALDKPKKIKKKNFKSERLQIENDVEKAVNKSLGIVEPEVVVEQVEETRQPEIDYSAQINNMMLRMQAEALELSIEQYLIESELDDEEAILFFL